VWADYLKAKENLAFAIKSIVVEESGVYAFAGRSIWVESADGARANQFDNISPDKQTLGE
jgi:hypothetical protein